MILQVEARFNDEQVAHDTGMKLQGRPSPITNRIIEGLARELAKEMMKRGGLVKLNWETTSNHRTFENETRVRASVVVGQEIEYTAPSPPTYQSTWVP